MHSWLQKAHIFSRKHSSMLFNEYEKWGSLYEKGGKLLYGYETKQNLDLLDYRKKSRAQVKIEKAEHHFQEIPKFPTVRKCV